MYTARHGLDSQAGFGSLTVKDQGVVARLKRPAAVAGEDLLDGEQEVEFGEALEDAAFGPTGVELEHVAAEEAGGGVFDAGLFEIGGSGVWPGDGVEPGRT
jgi:hypothetical protein